MVKQTTPAKQHSSPGAEPTTADFTVLTYGEEYRTAEGIVLATDPTKPFSSMEKFGQIFLEHLLGIEIPSRLLQNVTIIDTPGILENRRQVTYPVFSPPQSQRWYLRFQQERGYPYNAVLRWLVMRADLIFVVFDPTKLDVGTELESLFKVYVGSFWNKPYKSQELQPLLMREEKSLLLDMREIIRNQVHNKIAFMRQHAIRVRIHALLVDSYVAAYRRNKGIFDGADELARHIVSSPESYNVFKTILAHPNVSEYDLPDPDEYTEFFQINPLAELKRVGEICSWTGSNCPFEKMNRAIGITLPAMLKSYQAEIGEQTCYWRGGYCFPTPEEDPKADELEARLEAVKEIKGPAKWKKQKAPEAAAPKPTAKPPPPKPRAVPKSPPKKPIEAEKPKPAAKQTTKPKVMADAADFEATGFEKEARGFEEPLIEPQTASKEAELDGTGFEEPLKTGYESEAESPGEKSEELPTEEAADDEGEEEGSEEKPPVDKEDEEETAEVEEQPKEEDDEGEEATQDKSVPSDEEEESEEEGAEEPEKGQEEEEAEGEADDQPAQEEQAEQGEVEDDEAETVGTETVTAGEKSVASVEDADDQDESYRAEPAKAGAEKWRHTAAEVQEDEGEEEEQKFGKLGCKFRKSCYSTGVVPDIAALNLQPVVTIPTEVDEDEDLSEHHKLEKMKLFCRFRKSCYETGEAPDMSLPPPVPVEVEHEEEDDDDFDLSEAAAKQKLKLKCKFRQSCYETGEAPDIDALKAQAAAALDDDEDDDDEIDLSKVDSEAKKKFLCRYRKSCYETGQIPDLTPDNDDEDDDDDEQEPQIKHKKKEPEERAEDNVRLTCKYRTSCYKTGELPDIDQLVAQAAEALSRAPESTEDDSQLDEYKQEALKKLKCRFRTSCYESGVVPDLAALEQEAEEARVNASEREEEEEEREMDPKLKCRFRKSCYETGEAPDIEALVKEARSAQQTPQDDEDADDEDDEDSEKISMKQRLKCKYRKNCYETGETPDIQALKAEAAAALAAPKPEVDDEELSEAAAAAKMKLKCKFRKNCYETGDLPDILALQNQAAEALENPQEDEEDDEELSEAAAKQKLKLKCKFRKNCYETGEAPDIEELNAQAAEKLAEDKADGDDDDDDEDLSEAAIKQKLKLKCKFRRNCYETGEAPDLRELEKQAADALAAKAENDSEEEEEDDDEDGKTSLKTKLKCRYRKDCYETGEKPDLKKLAQEAEKSRAERAAAPQESDRELSEYEKEYKQHLDCKFRKSCYDSGIKPDIFALKKQADEASQQAGESSEEDDEALSEAAAKQKQKLRCKFRKNCYETGELLDISELMKQAQEAQAHPKADEDDDDEIPESELGKKVRCRYRSSCYETGVVPKIIPVVPVVQHTEAQESASREPTIQEKCKWRKSCYESGELPDILALKVQANTAAASPIEAAEEDEEISEAVAARKLKLKCKFKKSCFAPEDKGESEDSEKEETKEAESATHEEAKEENADDDDDDDDEEQAKEEAEADETEEQTAAVEPDTEPEQPLETEQQVDTSEDGEEEETPEEAGDEESVGDDDQEREHESDESQTPTEEGDGDGEEKAEDTDEATEADELPEEHEDTGKPEDEEPQQSEEPVEEMEEDLSQECKTKQDRFKKKCKKYFAAQKAEQSPPTETPVISSDVHIPFDLSKCNRNRYRISCKEILEAAEAEERERSEQAPPSRTPLPQEPIEPFDLSKCNRNRYRISCRPLLEAAEEEEAEKVRAQTSSRPAPVAQVPTEPFDLPRCSRNRYRISCRAVLGQEKGEGEGEKEEGAGEGAAPKPSPLHPVPGDESIPSTAATLNDSQRCHKWKKSCRDSLGLGPKASKDNGGKGGKGGGGQGGKPKLYCPKKKKDAPPPTKDKWRKKPQAAREDSSATQQKQQLKR